MFKQKFKKKCSNSLKTEKSALHARASAQWARWKYPNSINVKGKQNTCLYDKRSDDAFARNPLTAHKELKCFSSKHIISGYKTPASKVSAIVRYFS